VASAAASPNVASPPITRERLTIASRSSVRRRGFRWRSREPAAAREIARPIFDSASWCGTGSMTSAAISRYTFTKVSTTAGSYILPRRSSTIFIASTSLRAGRYGRSDVNAS